MESIKKLKEVATACLDELKAIESKISITEGNIAFLQGKKVSLTAEIADWETKKSAVIESVGSLEREARIKIDDQLRALKNKEDEIVTLRADLKTKLFQAESARAEAEQARAKYSEMYSEYAAKVEELNAKKLAVMDALK